MKAASILKLNTSLRRMLLAVQCLLSLSVGQSFTPNHPDVVERNARYLARLYHEANIKEPPIMEWTFLTNVMQAYTGNKENSVFACGLYGIQTAHVLDSLPS